MLKRLAWFGFDALIGVPTVLLVAGLVRLALFVPLAGLGQWPPEGKR
jgi:ABC-type phosphate transport system permease subunit